MYRTCQIDNVMNVSVIFFIKKRYKYKKNKKSSIKTCGNKEENYEKTEMEEKLYHIDSPTYYNGLASRTAAVIPMVAFRALYRGCFTIRGGGAQAHIP